jgi:hypothetical protein
VDAFNFLEKRFPNRAAWLSLELPGVSVSFG